MFEDSPKRIIIALFVGSLDVSLLVQIKLRTQATPTQMNISVRSTSQMSLFPACKLGKFLIKSLEFLGWLMDAT